MGCVSPRSPTTDMAERPNTDAAVRTVSTVGLGRFASLFPACFSQGGRNEFSF